MPDDTDKQDVLKNRQGIFGFGFSSNNNLDLLNLCVLAFAGIIIKVFFQESHSRLGNIGPASTTIWGYGMTSLALFFMMFISFYLKDREEKSTQENSMFNLFNDKESKDDSIMNTIINYILNDSLPIFLTLLIIIYIMYLNFNFFKRINSNRVTDTFHTYSFFSSLMIIIQLGLICKYMFEKLNTVQGNKDVKDNGTKLKGVIFVLSTINFIFILIMHILLKFFSTDG
tara:strand:- start:1633 stop:2316 length:684 start_codon:yes stop_codon:yes gene_type:complete